MTSDVCMTLYGLAACKTLESMKRCAELGLLRALAVARELRRSTEPSAAPCAREAGCLSNAVDATP